MNFLLDSRPQHVVGHIFFYSPNVKVFFVLKRMIRLAVFFLKNISREKKILKLGLLANLYEIFLNHNIPQNKYVNQQERGVDGF